MMVATVCSPGVAVIRLSLLPRDAMKPGGCLQDGDEVDTGGTITLPRL